MIGLPLRVAERGARGVDERDVSHDGELVRGDVDHRREVGDPSGALGLGRAIRSAAGTYVIVSSAMIIVMRNGIVAHITSVIGRWNLTLVMNRLSPTGGWR